MAERKEKISMLAAKMSELILTVIVITLVVLRVLATRSWQNLSMMKTYGLSTTLKLGKSLPQMVTKDFITSMMKAPMQIQQSSTALPMPIKELAKKTEIANGMSLKLKQIKKEEL